jgi:hypothetical protein
VIAADAQNDSLHLKGKLSMFSQCIILFFANSLRVLLNAGNSLFNVMFKVFEALELLLWTLFTRNSRRKISSGVGLGTVVAKDHNRQSCHQRNPARKLLLCLQRGKTRNMKPVIPFILFQQSN